MGNHIVIHVRKSITAADSTQQNVDRIACFVPEWGQHFHANPFLDFIKNVNFALKHSTTTIAIVITSSLDSAKAANIASSAV